jgi:hypothetical protein
MYSSLLEVMEGTSDEISNFMRKNQSPPSSTDTFNVVEDEFIWFGKNGRYALVQQYQVDGLNCDVCAEWITLDYSVSLQEFGSDKNEHVNITAAITNEDNTNDYCYYCIDQVDRDPFTKISNWLQLNISTADTARIMFDAARECENIHYAKWKCFRSNYCRMIFSSLEELQQLRKKFLEDDGWANEIDFVTLSTIAKLKVMNLVKNAKTLHDQARDEIFELIEHAAIKCERLVLFILIRLLTGIIVDDGHMIEGTINQPKLPATDGPGQIKIRMHGYELVFFQNGMISFVI